jgi:opacity protein-like surface antigen
MIRKFATVPASRIVLSSAFLLTILAGATVQSQQTPAPPAPVQQTPASQTPDNQQSSSQEASPEETSSKRKSKPRTYNKWTFNVGGGASLTNGTTRNFVKGGGGVAAAGVARNYASYFGLRADFQWDNLPLRTSALQMAQAPSASSRVYSLMVDPIFNFPLPRRWSGYALIGPAFYHRSGSLDSSTAVPGSACNAFYTWWGSCFNASLPLNKSFLSASLNQFGLNFGGGVAHKIRPNVDLYFEFRYLHGKHNNITTDLRPITVGVRW